LKNVAEKKTEDMQEFVSFQVTDQNYCIDIMTVREIRSWAPATILPHAPDYLLGVINLRGSVVPIIHLAIRLGLPARPLGGRQVFIITATENQTVGILVDSVSDIFSIPDTQIKAAPALPSKTTPPFVRSLIATENQMLRLLDLNVVLSSTSEGG